MRHLAAVIRELNDGNGRHLRRAAVLAAMVPLAGAALLGLSGWFITASAMAGAAGLGLVFDFLRPSGGIRTLTLIRAFSRYGERLLGHDATLRALERLRLRLFRDLSAVPLHTLARRHSAQMLNRLTADVEALEGLLIRLVFPTFAAALSLLIGLGVIWIIGGGALAGALAAIWAMGVLCLARLAGGGQRADARREEAALQAIRSRAAGLLALRGDLLMQGLLAQGLDQAKAAIARATVARSGQNLMGRLAGVVIHLVPGMAIAATLVLGGSLSPALLLTVILINLALTECLRLLWRGWSERGRIELAARNLARRRADTRPAPDPMSAPAPLRSGASLLAVRQLVVHAHGSGRVLSAPVDFTLDPGETLAIHAPSGAGKSTLLAMLARAAASKPGEITLLGRDLCQWPEADLRAGVTLVPQRPALIAGSLADNLRIADPQAGDAALAAVMQAVALSHFLTTPEGLGRQLGERGAGLSGGETRRLALARALLRQPDLLLVDEPTEGLDPANAAAVLQGLRAYLPRSGIILVSHRESDLAGADRRLQLPPADRDSRMPPAAPPLHHITRRGAAPLKKEATDGH
ncbi:MULTISPECIES: amino acid ABC transporter ATP-binding/permease protein [Paracoccaceae]|uniref:amino acid ABC transporter ATP-binding/permease protein n=1 Tax=Paracoccaceae TaxID=31989 RepID=UPI0015718375|nr:MULTISPECIES: ATP-binding cassette domain-containing protein [Paracoccaceae]MBJ2153446.1 ATP-binding cassette domain-containing protein [Paracoccus sp. IB05]NTT88416.1 ATP-binding cassette domain-containing protein [Tabrizicola sp. SY72]